MIMHMTKELNRSRIAICLFNLRIATEHFEFHRASSTSSEGRAGAVVGAAFALLEPALLHADFMIVSSLQ